MGFSHNEFSSNDQCFYYIRKWSCQFRQTTNIPQLYFCVIHVPSSQLKSSSLHRWFEQFILLDIYVFLFINTDQCEDLILTQAYFIHIADSLNGWHSNENASVNCSSFLCMCSNQNLSSWIHMYCVIWFAEDMANIG